MSNKTANSGRGKFAYPFVKQSGNRFWSSNFMPVHILPTDIGGMRTVIWGNRISYENLISGTRDLNLIYVVLNCFG